MTFADDLELAAEGETILHAVIGGRGWTGYGDDERHARGLARQDELLPWAEARPLLDYEYDRGFGSPDCPAVYAWTDSTVLFVTQYDGATVVDSVPRNPVAVVPKMPGG